MKTSSLSTAEYTKKIENHIATLRKEVRRILETDYKMNINTAEKLMKTNFAPNYLPGWYFFSHTAAEIASHIIITSQLLDANMEYLRQASEDGKAISYFLNIGRDYPGRLARIIKENIDMGIVSYDSVKTSSGIRMISIEKWGERKKYPTTRDELKEFEKMRETVCALGKEEGFSKTGDFLACLTHNYLNEELNNPVYPRRISRHLKVFENSANTGGITILAEDTSNESDGDKLDYSEKRLTIAVKNPDENFVFNILNAAKECSINLNRSYYDILDSDTIPYSIGIVSLYFPAEFKTDLLEKVIKDIHVAQNDDNDRKSLYFEKRLESIVRELSKPRTKKEKLNKITTELKELIAENKGLHSEKEIGDFLLNCFTDFFEALEFLDLDDNNEVIQMLLSFDCFDEFFVLSKNGEEFSNKPGFRAKHNTARGKAYKGGLRIDPIVKFVEVAALAFMMTWKSARSRILFGGAKGGLMLNPKVFDDNRIDFFDTLTNFGRSLFLVTGPSQDVPAGDVGCGGAEIGNMFEGFKSALRDLALMAYGLKSNLSIIGNKVISVEEARRILIENFNIDSHDMDILRELVTSEEYLELVAAPQITGKPKMGVEARTGATGRGLCFSILAVVTSMYLENKWQPSEEISTEEKALLKKAASINEEQILKNSGINLLTDEEWTILDTVIYKKLFTGKKLVVQGSGKVGSSILREMNRYGVNVIAVSDAGGALIGENLDVEAMIKAVAASAAHPERSKRNSIIGFDKNVQTKLNSASEGSAILELDCDILVTAALENAITVENAGRIKAQVIACGSNGSNTPKADLILNQKGVTVIYDFLANQGGVNASYFEWLRNLSERFRYESVSIRHEEFNADRLDDYIMPEFRDRIKAILVQEESREVTAAWNMVMRDIMFAASNEDYTFAARHNISMKTAGFVNSLLRVFSAQLLNFPEETRSRIWDGVNEKTRSLLKQFFLHPESEMHSSTIKDITARLYP